MAIDLGKYKSMLLVIVEACGAQTPSRPLAGVVICAEDLRLQPSSVALTKIPSYFLSVAVVA